MRTPLRLALGLSLCFLLSCRSSADGPGFGQATFSPDGKVVAFVRQEAGSCFIYLGNLDTRAAKRLTKTRGGCEADPDFSHDGKTMVYSYAPKGERKSSLYLVGIDGADPHQISPSETDDIYPHFSPDGKMLYFARSGRFGHSSPIAASRQHDFDLFSYDLSTGKIAQLTQQSLYDVQSLDASPDGEQLLISTSRYPIGGLIETYAVANPQSPHLVFQAHVPDEPRLGPAYGQASYIPVANSLQFLLIAASNKSGGNYDYNVYDVNLVTGKIEGQLTNLRGMTTGVQASPNGKQAILENEGKMYLLDLQTHNAQLLNWTGL